MNRSPLAIGLVLVSAAPVIGDAAPEPAGPFLGFSAGHVGLFDDLREPAIASVEYRFPWQGRPHFALAIGAAAAENGASFVYADLHLEYWINDRWVLSPSIGVGRFGDSDEIDLGHLVEFRTGLEIAYQFDNGYRTGLVLQHYSNGGISERNPGIEELALTFYVPLSD